MTTTSMIEEECKQIRQLLGKYIHHKEIYAQLGMGHATYYRRLEKIYAEDKLNNEDYAKRNLEDRTQRIEDALDLVSNTSFEITNDKNQKAKDRIQASLVLSTSRDLH